jgi:branched-chain amino acid transport system substrate-binding protein
MVLFAVLLPLVSPVASLGATEPVEVNVVLSLTGGGAFLAKAEQLAIEQVEILTNKTGGIRGRPLKFVIVDDESNPQIAIQLTGPMIARGVPFILGPDLTAPCSAVTPLVDKAGPVMYCISPGINPVANGYIFSANASLRSDAAATVRYFRQRGWTKIGLIVSTDSTGQSFESAFNRALALPENRTVEAVPVEHFATSDMSVNAQLERMKSTNPQAIIAWSTGPSFATLLRAIHDVGFDGPVAGGNGNMILAQLMQYGAFMPKQMYFPGQRVLAEGTAAGPVHDAQTLYRKAFSGIGITQLDWGDMEAWDPAMLIVTALRDLGPDASANQLHDYFEHLHGWAGINGIYDFRDGEQRGIGIESVVIDQWMPKADDFIAVSHPGGLPR